MKRRLMSALFLVFAAGAVHAQPRDPLRYSRLLLPIHLSVQVAGGTWAVQWWVRNDDDQAADVFPLANRCGLPVPGTPQGIPVSIFQYPAAPAHAFVSCLANDAPSFPVPAFIPVRSPVGAFLFVEKAAKQLSVSGSLLWQTQTASSDPVPLHAVPESWFVTGTHSVFPVPVLPGRRYTIRVYALPETVQSTRINIRVFDMQPASVLSVQEKLINTVSGDLVLAMASLFPCQNDCDVPPVELAPAVMQIFDVTSTQPMALFASPVRIEVSPASGDVRWWAVVSATDNTTQQVSLYEPVH